MTTVSSSIRTRGFVSAHQVAKLAGVSRSAVSRAFTDGASIAPETRDRVMQAAETLGYHVNDLARGLLGGRSRLVGIVATRPEIGIRPHLIAALTAGLIRRGSVPVMLNTGITGEDRASAQRILTGHRAEAVIVLSGSPPSSFVDAARRSGQPVVVLGRADPDTDRLMTANDAAGREAAALFHAQGLLHVGLVTTWNGTQSLIEREHAFQDEAQKRGLHVTVGRGAGADYPSGVEGARSVLDAAPNVEALFCVNDLLALGSLDHARSERGRLVPDDLAVIGFDDIPEAGWASYQLTTFRQDPQIMAAAAIAMIEWRQANPDRPPASRMVAAPLVIRATAKGAAS